MKIQMAREKCLRYLVLIGVYVLGILGMVACGGSGGGDDDDSSSGSCSAPDPIATNSITNGSLTSSDCTVERLYPSEASDEAFIDQYLVTLARDGEISIQLDSSEFDAVLILTNSLADLPPIAFDDDSGSGLNASLTVNLTIDSYIIAASSALVTPETGSYTLTTSFTQNAWSPTPTFGAPEARRDHTSVWTGNRMIVWGGVGEFSSSLLASGAQFYPDNNTWVSTTIAGAPSPRYGHTAVWAGSEMLIWGGFDGNTLGDGAGYSPDTDTWLPFTIVDQPSARVEHTAVWTGTEMIVWGGVSALATPGSELGTGARYNPSTDTWTPMSMINAPEARGNHTAVWTGTSMIVWGGVTDSGSITLHNSGGAYDPVTDTWTSLSLAPVPKRCHSAVWTGTEMIIFGGQTNTGLACFLTSDGTGAKYDPASDSWSPITNAPISSSGSAVRSIWSGDRLITWFDDVGARYDPISDMWTGVSADNSPSSRRRHTLVWTGSEMIVWGGDSAGTLDTGGIYFPQGDSTP
jgi:hypothetical protein